MDSLYVDQAVGQKQHLRQANTLFRYGVTESVEVRWAPPARISQSGEGAPPLHGSGDQTIGVLYRFHNKTNYWPDLAVDYALSIPTADPGKGFGSGFFDHGITFIASRDVGATHLDFNALETFAGSDSGHDASTQAGVAISRQLSRRLLGTVEAYGGAVPGERDLYAAFLAGAAWSLHPWLAVNAAYSSTEAAGHRSGQVMVGFIYTFRPFMRISQLGR